MPKLGPQSATQIRDQAAAQRLAAGESQVEVYKSLHPRSAAWKPGSLSVLAHRMAVKLLPMVKEIQANGGKTVGLTFNRKREVLEDIVEGRMKVKDDGSAAIQQRLVAVDIDNKMTKTYDTVADNRQLVIILRDAPTIGTVEKPVIDAQSVAKSVANSTPPALNP